MVLGQEINVQDQFGGYGPGLIPATNVYSTISFKQRYSENFKRFTCFGGESLKSRKYGVMASAARFTKEFDIDSTFILDTIKEQTGWIEISPSGSAYDRARTYNNVTMHYNSCNYPVKVKVFQNGTLIHEEMLKQDGKQNTLKFAICTWTDIRKPTVLKKNFHEKIQVWSLQKKGWWQR